MFIDCIETNFKRLYNMYRKKTKNQCNKCEQRRKDNFMFCLCGNKLWDFGVLGFKPCKDMYSYKGEQ